MKDNDIKTQLKKALKVIFEFSYDELYKEYSSANPLSDEIEFINYLIKNQKQHIDVIESKIDFFFNNEITTEEEYENIIKRDEFWFFKQYSTYLKDKLSKLNKLPPQPIDKEQNRTKKVIAETFENMDKKGWQYAFATEQDYNLFADLLTNFFEYKDYSIPNTAIQLKRTCKTKVAKALGEIHAELSEKPLKSDTEYFKIVQVLNHFKDVSNFDLVKAMQR